MTSLFGCMCNQPQHLAEALEPVRSALVARAPVARWGVGYVHGGEVLLSRNPRVSEKDVEFLEVVERARADYFIGHPSPADGLSGSVNTQPFRFRQWMFAQAGGSSLDELQPKILEHIPLFLQRTLKGKTVAEHVFHLFLSLLHDAGTIDDPNLPVAEIRHALRDTVALVFSLLTQNPVAAPGIALDNIVVSNSRSMLAMRLDAPMFMRRLKIQRSKGDPNTFRGVLALCTSSETDENELGEGFEEIPRRSVLTIGRDLRTDILPLDA